MRAAVLVDVDRSVIGPRDDDRSRPDIRADEIAGLLDLGLQPDVIPGRAVEDALDLALIDELVGIAPIRDDTEIVIRPDVVPAHCGSAVVRRRQRTLRRRTV